MHDSVFFQEIIENELRKIQLNDHPAELYDPIRYMLSLGGKRLRPSLVLMGAELFDGDYTQAISPALGIEVFHNFTLLHDDIMDKAPLLRSKETVYKKWNADVAILSGDTMFVKSCELMMQTDDHVLREVMHLFYRTAVEVCEGQQLDMNYESTDAVTIDEYIRMISLKTAALLACSLKTGALIAGSAPGDAELLYRFGLNIGIAFQLHDDLLDVYGDEQKFGKQAGGDILANKKTFLLLKATEKADGKNLAELKKWMASTQHDPAKKIEGVKEIYSALGIQEEAGKKMDEFFDQAMHSFDRIHVPENRKAMLRNFAEKLMVREV